MGKPTSVSISFLTFLVYLLCKEDAKNSFSVGDMTSSESISFLEYHDCAVVESDRLWHFPEFEGLIA
jgi:hypothetical protein